MEDIRQAGFLQEFIRTMENMYAHGWDEKNGGNLSLLLEEEQLRPYLAADAVRRRMDTGFACPALAGRCLLITGTGKYFKNVRFRPQDDLGVIRIADDGASVELLWGFEDGGSFTSELPAHLMSHSARLAADPAHRVVLHCHPDALIAMTHVHPLDERRFTRTLWKMCTEAIIALPEGAAVLPWMLCGTQAIGAATAGKMARCRLVVWAMHGVYGAGSSLDDAYGLVETADKAAGIYLRIAGLPRGDGIPDEGLRALAERFALPVRDEWLDGTEN